MNVLAVVAHPDDEIFGCGATLKKLSLSDHRIFTCVLCGSADARFERPPLERLTEVSSAAEKLLGIEESITYDFPNIRINSVPHLDVVKAIERAIHAFEPSWIFTHYAHDLNVDHRVAYEATMAAVMLPQRLSTKLPPHLVTRVSLCEIPSSTEWSLHASQPFVPNSFVDVSDTIATKLEALDAFEGALKPHPHPRSRENVENLARVRGAHIGTSAAEAFMIVRDLVL